MLWSGDEETLSGVSTSTANSISFATKLKVTLGRARVKHLQFQGQVVGITTAIISDSQGLGFAVPLNTILREIASLVTTALITSIHD